MRGRAVLGTLLALCASAAAQERLTLESLYSVPSPIGTAPIGFAWSADGRRLAFAWNDAGYPLRDVFTLEVDAPLPVRRSTLASEENDEIGVVALAWHPDGERVVFERAGELFLLDVATSETLALGAGRAAAFSPDGRYLSFLDGGDLLLLAVDALSAPPKRLVADARAEIRVDRYRWAPGSRRIALLSHDDRRVPLRGIPDYLGGETEMTPVRRAFPGEAPRAYRLGVVSIDGERTELDVGAPPEEPIFSFRWSPDGARLLVDRSDLYVKDRRILSLDPDSEARTEWYRETSPSNVSADWQAEWAPSGRGVFFLSDRDEDYGVYFLSAPGGEPERLTGPGFAVSELAVTSGGVVFVANAPRPEERHVFRLPLEGGEPVRVSETPGTHAPVVSPEGRFAAVRVSSDTMPPELFLTSLEGGGERRITNSPLPGFSQHAWGTPEYVTFPSHVDGATLHGRLLVPPGLDRSRRHPAIVGSVYANTVRNQWGGRDVHPVWGLDQLLLQRGYVLLNVDVRGSWGHGKAFRQGIRLDYGGIDVEDIASGVHYLESLGFVDMERVGIWGSSYGGLLTCMSLFRKPELYRAGVAGAPATNVFHALTGEMRVMMAPQDEGDAYAEASPATHAAGLEDPLLLIHGMRDRVVLYQDSVALVQRLIDLGKDVDFVTLPDAGHGWDLEDLAQTRFAYRKLVEFFDRHLKGTPP